MIWGKILSCKRLCLHIGEGRVSADRYVRMLQGKEKLQKRRDLENHGFIWVKENTKRQTTDQEGSTFEAAMSTLWSGLSTFQTSAWLPTSEEYRPQDYWGPEAVRDRGPAKECCFCCARRC